MKLGTARVFVPTEYQAPSAGQTRLPGHSPGKATRTKRRNEAYPPDTERFVQRRASFEGLAGIKGLHRSNSSGALAVKPNQRTQARFQFPIILGRGFHGIDTRKRRAPSL